MGRIKYTRPEREAMIAVFLKAAREIIGAEGIARVSIRAVAKKTGYSSASLYLYFKDLDELISMAVMEYYEAFCRELTGLSAGDARQAYTEAWRTICKYAFDFPEIFQHIFFAPRARPMKETAEAYYEIFPQKIEDGGEALRRLLLAGTLEERNFAILGTLIDDGSLSATEAELVSNMTVGYFRTLLDERRGPVGDSHNAEPTERQLTAVDFLLRSAIKNKRLDMVPAGLYNPD